MKKAILAALLASTTFFGSEAMERPGLAPGETFKEIVTASLARLSEPLFQIDRMDDGSLNFCVNEVPVHLSKGQAVRWENREALTRGIPLLVGDPFEITPDMTNEEIMERLKLGLNCEVTIQN
jgi:hypothetical protein